MPKPDNMMNRVKFTVGKVSAFQCGPNKLEQLLWDTDEKTLNIRARNSGGKTFYFQSRFNGKVIKIKIGNISDKELTISQARRRAREYQAQIDSGVDPRLEIKRSIYQEEHERAEIKKRTVTFEQVWDEYVEVNRGNWSEGYLQDHYKSMGTPGRKRQRSQSKTVAGVLYSFRKYRLEEITPSNVTNWINKEKQSRPTVTARGYRMLRACLNWANGQDQYYQILDMDRLFRSGTVRRSLPKSKPKQDALEKSHLPLWFSIIRKLENPVISAYLQALLLTGARRDEMASMKWEDVDFRWQSMRIKDKVEGERTIPLTPYISLLLTSLPRRNEFVFSSPQSKSGRLQDVYRCHSRALVEVGIPHVSIHGLRRSFGSLSEWVECPVGIVAQIQGHKPSATAEKHYRVRPLDLLRVWHIKIEKEILEFGGVVQPPEASKSIRMVT